MNRIIPVTLLCLIELLSVVGHADVLSPTVEDARKRFDANPKAFDRVDQYCADKDIDAACTVPGNAFEGGGAGICSRELKSDRNYISLTCTLQEPVTIDRQLPDSAYNEDTKFCAIIKHKYQCIKLPVVSDRFCQKKKVGSACVVTLTRGGRVPETYSGVCHHGVVYYWARYYSVSRHPIMCDPKNPTPERVYTVVHPLEKLGQW